MQTVERVRVRLHILDYVASAVEAGPTSSRNRMSAALGLRVFCLKGLGLPLHALFGACGGTHTQAYDNKTTAVQRLRSVCWEAGIDESVSPGAQFDLIRSAAGMLALLVACSGGAIAWNFKCARTN